MKEYKETLPEKILHSRERSFTADKNAYHPILSSPPVIWFDVLGDLSLQTCYSSVVYLKCLRAFLYLNVKQEPNPKILT